MLYFGGPFTVEQSQEWIERQLERYARDGFGYWLIVDRASGLPVGQVGQQDAVGKVGQVFERFDNSPERPQPISATGYVASAYADARTVQALCPLAVLATLIGSRPLSRTLDGLFKPILP